MPAAPRIASATDKLIIHNLGLKVLGSGWGSTAGTSEFKFVGNHLNAARPCEVRGEADLGFVFQRGAGERLHPRRTASDRREPRRPRLPCFMVARNGPTSGRDPADLKVPMHSSTRPACGLEDPEIQSVRARIGEGRCWRPGYAGSGVRRAPLSVAVECGRHFTEMPPEPFRQRFRRSRPVSAAHPLLARSSSALG